MMESYWLANSDIQDRYCWSENAVPKQHRVKCVHNYTQRGVLKDYHQNISGDFSQSKGITQ